MVPERETRVCWTLVALIAVLAPLVTAGEVEFAAPSAKYKAEIEDYRAQRIKRLVAPGGWLSVSGLHWLEEGDNFFGSSPENEIVFPASTSVAVAGNLKYAEGVVFLLPLVGGDVLLNGEPARGTQLSDGASPAKMEVGRLSFSVISRFGRHAIRVKDPENPAISGFEGIDFFPVDASYRVTGKLVPYEKSRPFVLETVVGSDTEMLSKGGVEFDLGGETQRLEGLANSEDATELFLIFKDATSTSSTYAAGRYLYASVDAENRVTIDFNKAYNPPCAFTPYATCPLPPASNTLAASIEAGEMRYHAD